MKWLRRMYCELCRCERMGTSTRCAACGGGMVVRDRARLEGDLGHVRWALEDALVWDASVVSPAVRAWVLQRFRTQERALVGCLVPEVKHVAPVVVEVAVAASPAPVLLAAPTPVEAAREAAREAVQRLVEPASAPDEARVQAQAREALARAAEKAEPKVEVPPGPVADVESPAVSVEDKVVEAASSWNKFWRPFLNESIGWFIGAFLILAGTFYFVADVWTDLDAQGQAALVFVGTAVWTCGFFAWARFLFRREATRSAGRVLQLIAAVIAPLPTVALWPLASGWAIAFWPLLAIWALIAVQLMRAVAREYDARAQWPLAFGMAATTVMMALAPLAAQLGRPVLWLNLTPLLALAFLAQQGPREKKEAQVFSMLAPLYLLGLFAARLVIALDARHAMPPLPTLAAFAAAALCLLLELREAPARKSADPWAIAVVALQLGLAVLSGFGEAPAFFVTCAMGAVTTARLAQRGPSGPSANWLYFTYALAYFAWQACGQLVPGVLMELLAAIKSALGYAPSQPLPPSYNAVYAAAYVVVVGVFALVRARSAVPRLKASAPVLLRATVVTSVLVAAMALPVVAVDARPTVWSLPFVAALCLAIAQREERKEAAWAGAMLVALSAVGVAFLPGVSAPLVVGAIALLAASLAGKLKTVARQPLLIAGAALAVSTAVLAFAGPAQVTDVAGLAFAFAAALVAARETKVELSMEAALALLPLTAARAAQLGGPEFAVVALAASAWALAAAGQWKGLLAARRVAVAYALGAAVLALGLPHAMGALLDPTLLVCAAALAVADARRWPGVVAIALAAAAFCLKPWPWDAALTNPVLAMGLGLAASAGSAFWAWKTDRNWHAGMLAFCGAVLGVAGAATYEPALLNGFGQWPWLMASLAVLLAGRALMPSLMLPVAAVLAVVGLPFEPENLATVALAVASLGLLQRWTWGRAHLLGGLRLAWSAAVTAALLMFLAALWVADGQAHSSAGLAWVGFLAVAVPLLSVAATRNAASALLLAPGLAIVGSNVDPSAMRWILPAVVVTVSRLAAGSARVRRLLGLANDGALQWLLAVPLAVSGLLLGIGHHWMTVVPAALGVALVAAAPVSVRLALAAAMLLLVPSVMAPAALVLVALAFALHHAQAPCERVLGAKADALAVQAAVVSGLVLALFAQVVPGAGALATGSLVAALVGTGLLLGNRWFFTAAVVALAVPLTGLPGRAGSFDAEGALGVALGGAALAALLVWNRAASLVRAALSAVGRGFDGEVRPALWWGAAASAVLAVAQRAPSLPPELGAMLAAVAVLLLVTRARVEAGVAGTLLAFAAALMVPVEWRGVAVGAVGLSLCAAGAWLEQRFAAAKAWHWTGLALSVLAIALAADLHHPSIALTWSGACAAAWLAVRGKEQANWVGWVASLAAVHVVLFWGGLTFSHGDPKTLILPWVGAASMLLAAAALLKNRVAFAYSAAAFGVCELLAGLVLLNGTWPREAVVATVGLGALLWALARRASQQDSKAAAALAQVAAASLWAAWHVLGFGGVHGAVDAVAMLVLGLAAHGLSVTAARAGKDGAARVLALGGYAWPLVGVGLVLDATPWTLGSVLLGAAAHFAWLAQAGRWKRSAALMAASAFNLSLLTMWTAAGWSSSYYLLIVAGLSVLVLVKLFEADLGADWAAKLRGIAAATIYGAAAWKPLAFDTTWALWVCVLVCVLGVAVGIALRVRSYVYLGTVFLVTSVVSNLVRFGVREPRVGALLLSSLGLLVVGFMVVVTTRRGELLERYRQVRTMLHAWEA